MDKEINKFIKHTIVNLEGALMKDNDELTLAVLTNLADTIDSYLEPLYLSVLSGKIEG
jgi:glutathionylspermidine synthase